MRRKCYGLPDNFFKIISVRQSRAKLTYCNNVNSELSKANFDSSFFLGFLDFPIFRGSIWNFRATFSGEVKPPEIESTICNGCIRISQCCQFNKQIIPLDFFLVPNAHLFVLQTCTELHLHNCLHIHADNETDSQVRIALCKYDTLRTVM